MSDLKMYHVEYDVESFLTPDGIRGYPVKVPYNAVITEIKKPVKVGDMIDDSDVLSRLPVCSGIVDDDGDIWQSDFDGKWILSVTFEKDKVPSEEVIGDYGPVTVIYIPKDDK